MILLNLVSLLRVTSRRRGSPSRVTVVSSYSYNLHTRNANPVFGDQDIIEYFDAEKNFGRYHRYFDSKLMMHGFVQQLADIVPQNEMVVNSVCPGVIATDLFLGVPTWVKPIMWVLRQVKGRTLEEGGRVIVHAATTAGKETHGELIRNGRIERHEFLY